MFLAIATLFKQPIGIVLICYLVIAIFDSVERATFTPKFIITGLIVGVLGELVVYLPVISFYFYRGALEEFLFQFLIHPFRYSAADAIPFSRRLIRIITYTEEYSRNNLLLSLGSAIGILVIIIDRKLANKTFAYFLVLCMTVTFIAVCLGPELFLNYYLIMLIPAVLTAAYLLDYLFRSQPLTTKFRVLIIAFITILATSTSIVTLKDRVKKYVTIEGNNKVNPIIDRLNVNTEFVPSSMYVWGYYPQLYIWSGLIPASKYQLTDVLVGFFNEGSKKVNYKERLKVAESGGINEFVNEIESKNNLVFVDASQSDSFGSGSFDPQFYPKIRDFLEGNCAFDSTHKYGKNNQLKLYFCNIIQRQ